MKELLKKFSTKKKSRSDEKSNKPYVLECKSEGILYGSRWLYRLARYNDQNKFGFIREAIKFDQGMSQFKFLRKLDRYNKVKEMTPEYAGNQTVLDSQ